MNVVRLEVLDDERVLRVRADPLHRIAAQVEVQTVAAEAPPDARIVCLALQLGNYPHSWEKSPIFLG